MEDGERTKIAEGFCRCGCGERTQLSDRNRPTRGILKGQPVRFVKGHNAKEMYMLRDRPAPSDHKWGEKNPKWKGDSACKDGGRHRAQRRFVLGACEVCGDDGKRRHHKDRNTLNNDPDNIQILCSRCHCRIHVEEDGKFGFIRRIGSGGRRYEN